MHGQKVCVFSRRRSLSVAARGGGVYFYSVSIPFILYFCRHLINLSLRGVLTFWSSISFAITAFYSLFYFIFVVVVLVLYMRGDLYYATSKYMLRYRVVIQ